METCSNSSGHFTRFSEQSFSNRRDPLDIVQLFCTFTGLNNQQKQAKQFILDNKENLKEPNVFDPFLQELLTHKKNDQALIFCTLLIEAEFASDYVHTTLTSLKNPSSEITPLK